MNSALYFPRYKSDADKYRNIISTYALDLDYCDKNEQVYSNQDIMMTLSKKYVAFYFFTEQSVFLSQSLRKFFRDKGNERNESF